MKKYTSIRVLKETRTRLLMLKKTPRESFDSVINRLIDFYMSHEH